LLQTVAVNAPLQFLWWIYFIFK